MTEHRKDITRFIAIFAGGTMLSRVTGLVRDSVMGHFVTEGPLGTFWFAFSITNMLRDMLGEGATNAAMVPVFSEIKEKQTEAEYKDAVASVLGAMLLVFTVITVIGVAVMPFIPGALGKLTPVTGKELTQTPEELAELVRILQWTFPYFLLVGLTTFAMAPLFVGRRYGTASWSPLLLNVALSASVVMTGWFKDPAWALVIGAWVGGVAQLVVLFWDMHRRTGILWPRFNLRHSATARVFLLLAPVLIGQATGEVNKLVDRFFAMSLGTDKVDALYYSQRLIQLPLSIFGIAVSVAILPTISRAATRGEFDSIRDTLKQGFRQSFFLIIPSLIGLVALGRPLIGVLYEHGHFSQELADKTNAAMFYGALGLLSFSWVKISVQGFYAVQNTITPVIVATISMALNIVFILLLVRPMGYLGLALATTLSYTVNFILLFILLSRRYGRLWDGELVLSLAKMTLSALLMGTLAWESFHLLQEFLGAATYLKNAVAVGGALVVAALAYAGGCALLKVPEFSQTLRILKR